MALKEKSSVSENKLSKEALVNAHEFKAVALPKIKGIQPFGSKILVEVLRDDEIMGTNLIVGAGQGTGGKDGAPQALIVKLGPGIPVDSGLAVGQRIYWSGKGTAIDDPQTVAGRTRALLEVSNILALIEEETAK